MLQKVYGEEHPEVAQTMGNLADFLTYNKPASSPTRPAELAEAEALHRKALAMNQRIRPDHPYIGDNYRALAELRRLQGDPREGEALAREALRIYRLKLPEGHEKVIAGQQGLAEVLITLERPKEAEPLLLEAHAALSGRPGGESQLVAVRESLALVYTALRQPARAAEYRPSP
jgi:tetratricopeptide (TPR) repeat protein